MANKLKEGVRPDRAFLYYRNSKKASPIVDDIMRVLGDRPAYMIYDKEDFAWGYKVPSIVEVLLGGTGELGLEVAYYLKKIIPECRYGFVGRDIIIHDVVNPFKIDEELFAYGSDPDVIWLFGKNGIDDLCTGVSLRDDKAVFSDSRFLVVVYDYKDLPVGIWIFRIPREEC